MASDSNRGKPARNLGAHGPERDRTFDQFEAQRNDLDQQSSHQTRSDDSQLGSGDETGNARRAGDASDSTSGPSHLGEAEDAFERSRGEERRR